MPESFSTCLHVSKPLTHACHPKASDYGSKVPPRRFNQNPSFLSLVESFCHYEPSESILHYDRCQAPD